MEKKWFIEINGIAQGPYSILDLKRDHRITPDTLVWRAGFPKWVMMRYVPELKEVFKDKPSNNKKEPEKKGKKLGHPTKDELAIDMRKHVPPYIFWVLIGLVLIIYIIYRMYQIQ